MALVELGTFGMVVLIGFVGLWMAQKRASLRSRRKLEGRKNPQVSPRT